MNKNEFRGKRVDSDIWAYGYYVYNGHTNKEKDMIIPIYASALYAFEVIPKTVGQFIGQTDINNKKAYEGDLCRVWESIGSDGTLRRQWQRLLPIVYEPLKAGFFFDDKELKELHPIDKFLFEVVSSIHD